MSEQIKARIEVLKRERQDLLDQINASPAAAKVQQITGALIELEQLLPKEEKLPVPPETPIQKVIKFPKKRLGGGKP